MARSQHVWAAVLALCLIGVAATANGQIVNGSFENPDIAAFQAVTAGSNAITGWSVGGVSVDLVDESNGFVVGEFYNGDQCVDLDGTPGPGVLFQTFLTTPGQVYLVSFAYANNYTGGGASASANVRVFSTSGNLMGPITITHGTSAPNSLDWVLFCGAFVADGTSATLEFASLSNPGSVAGITLDAVTVLDYSEQNCPADVAPCGGNDTVDIDDLFAIIGAWGTSNAYYDLAPAGKPNGNVDIDDLFAVIGSWGDCP